jgi:hypothetical protein
MKDKDRTAVPRTLTLTNLLDECFPRLPDGEFPRPPSLPRGGCFPEGGSKVRTPAGSRSAGRGKRRGTKR